MDYAKTKEYLKSLSGAGSKPGLERIRKLLELMGNPQDKLKFVHIAGTNGKGSVTAMISSTLNFAGHRCGAFFSPYVNDVRECFKIRGKKPTQSNTAAAFSYVKKFADSMAKEGDAPTEYEVITAAALHLFKTAGCDIVCMEACMGGKLDVTNISNSTLVSVITQIEIDHTKFLGESIAEITEHKCGILRENGICVSSPRQLTEALNTILVQCRKHSCKLIIPDTDDDSLIVLPSAPFKQFSYKNIEFDLSMIGNHQINNALTAIETLFALRAFGFNLPNHIISKGVSSAVLAARVERISKKPLVLLDSAHNLSGIKALCEVIDELGCKNTRVVIGMLADKEYEKCIALLAERSRKIYAVTPKNPRALPAEELAAAVSQLGCDSSSFITLEGAFDAAVKEIKKDETLIICGSFYVSMILRDKAINYFSGGLF